MLTDKPRQAHGSSVPNAPGKEATEARTQTSHQSGELELVCQ